MVGGYNGGVFDRIRNWLAGGWRQSWARAYIAFSPIGVLIATLLLSRYAGVWGWSDRESMGFLASLIPLGGVVYAAAILVMEWGVRMVFWALAQREKDIEKRRAEGEARGEARGEVRGRRQAREELLRVLDARGADVSPELFADVLSLDAVLLENGDVYGGPALDVYVGRINRAGRRVAARRGEAPKLSDLWCERGWRVRLEGHFEDLMPYGRIRGLRLDTSADVWGVSLDY